MKQLVTLGAACFCLAAIVAWPSPSQPTIRIWQRRGQFGDLRERAGNGFHPPAILVHGACWLAELAKLRDLARMAERLEAVSSETAIFTPMILAVAGRCRPGRTD